MNFKKNKGFTLTEILLVLVIAAAIVIAAFIIYPKVNAERIADSEAKRVMSIAAAVKGLYGSKANYNGLTLDVLKNSDAIDKRMFSKMDGGMPVTEFNALLSVVDAGMYFKIDYTQMKQDYCVRFVPKVGAAATIIQVNGIDVMTPNKPLDVASLSSLCSSTPIQTVSFFFL